MIHEVDEGLRLLLAAEGVPGEGAEVAFDAPTREWAAKRTVPTVNVFLYNLVEDLTRRATGQHEDYDENGIVTGWRAPPRWYQLSYLVTAWTARPTDEHRLLSEVLRGASRYQQFQLEWLTGSLAELGLAVLVDVAMPATEGTTSTSDIWHSLGGQLKPSISMRVTAPMIGDRQDTGPAVTEGIVVRTNPPDGDGRRLRYEGPTTAAGTGFSSTRTKPMPGMLRHHGGRV
jgi:Pvc16 N-terminal domain